MRDVQAEQDRQYDFPYHHVAQFRGGFKTSYFTRYGLQHASSLEWILEQIRQLNPNDIIDVGCGDGRLVLELDRDFPGHKVVGIDYSERTIHLAKGLHPNGDFRNIDILADSFPRQFDLATLIEVFEHIPLGDCQRFANQLAGLTRKGGFLMITVPHVNLPISKKHFQHFSLASLMEYFESDFDLKEVQYLERREGWRLFWYRRLLKNKLFLLNSQRLLNWIYRGYRKRYLLASGEHDCERLYCLLVRK